MIFIHKNRIALLPFLAAVCLAGFVYHTALAQQAAPTPSDDQVNAVASQLYCPVCENIPLDVCPTTACAQWRDLIRQKIAAGWSTTQIKDYFVQQYGDRVLAEPPRQGINWLVYIIPPLGILLGGGILYRVLNHMRKAAPAITAAPPSAPEQTDEYLKRVEAELRRRK